MRISYGTFKTQIKFSDNKLIRVFSVCSPQVSLDTMASPAHANTSTAVWGITVWSTTRRVRGSVSAWITVNPTINPCAVPMGSCTRTTVSCTGPPASADTGLPSCTARSAFTRVRTAPTSSNVEKKKEKMSVLMEIAAASEVLLTLLALFKRHWIHLQFLHLMHSAINSERPEEKKNAKPSNNNNNRYMLS